MPLQILQDGVIKNSCRKNKTIVMLNFLAYTKMMTDIAIYFANKNKKPKCIEIFEVTKKVLETYTDLEFSEYANSRPQENLEVNEGKTSKEKFRVLFYSVKEKMVNNDSPKLVDINNLLRNLTETEENDLIDIIDLAMTCPYEALADLF
jgi:inorganic pyrophosphatase/exopolyphosphatase